jgi:oligopeptide transport system substrate-binding protein
MRRSQIRILPFAALLAGAVLLSGCHGKGGSAGTKGNVLRYAINSPPTTTDPAKVQDGDTIDMLQQVFEGLVKWNDKNEVVPNLAEKWDISPDGKTYTFHLKDNVYFHEPFKRKVVAADFVYSLTRTCRKESNSPTAMNYLNDIVGAGDLNKGKGSALPGVKAVDDKTLQIMLDAPRPYFLAKLTYPTGYVVCKEAVDKAGPTWNEQAIVGTGPFKLRSYQGEYKIVLAANPDYHGEKPILEGIERPVNKDSNSRQTAYETGGLDYVDIERPELQRIQSDPVLSKELKQFDRANIYYLALNQQAFPPFKDKKVRQAFAYAIDKDQLIKLALRGTAKKANGILPPGIPGYDASFTGLAYDPAKAKQLLAEAGYPGGKGFPKLVISFRQGYQFLSDCVLAMRDDLKRNLGIEVDSRQVEWSQFLSERRNGTMPCYHLRWSADYIDPQNFLSLMLRTGSEENKIGYSNADFDKLCDAADVEGNAAKRTGMYQQAEKIAVDDAAWVCLYHLPDIELHKPYVKGIHDSLMGHLPHVTTSVTK